MTTMQEAIATTHRGWLRTILYARLRDVDAVDDVMQEIAVSTLRQPHGLRDETRLGPWLYRVAIRQALLYRRTCGRKRRLENGYREALEARGESHERDGQDASCETLAAEREQRVRDAVLQLPRRDREILLLKYSEDWDYRRIGERLGLSRSAVEARLHRARTRLREKLQGYLEER